MSRIPWTGGSWNCPRISWKSWTPQSREFSWKETMAFSLNSNAISLVFCAQTLNGMMDKQRVLQKKKKRKLNEVCWTSQVSVKLETTQETPPHPTRIEPPTSPSNNQAQTQQAKQDKQWMRETNLGYFNCFETSTWNAMRSRNLFLT